MKSIELLSTGIRLLGIYIFLYAFKTGAYQYQIFMNLKEASDTNLSLFASIGVFQFLLLFISGVLMFKFPVSLARWCIPKTRDDEIILNGSSQDIEISLFIIIGVYILSWAVPDFFNNAMWLWYISNTSIGYTLGDGADHEYIMNQIVTVIEIAVGLYLCLSAKGLSKLVRKFRG